jgi:K+-sensing histidine kinase KdpD
VLASNDARKPRSRSGPVIGAYLLGLGGLALITFICFRMDFGLARTGFAYVILLALVSVLGSFTASIVMSILAVACLNFFFAPPLFEFRIDAVDDMERMAAFLTTSLIVTALVTQLRAREARYRAFVDHATDAFFVLDEN